MFDPSDLVVPDFPEGLTELYEFDLPAVAPVARSHEAVHIAELGGLTMAVVRVDASGRTAYQLYAVTAETWCLTGYFGLLVDALSELEVWRSFVGRGGSLELWKRQHADGVQVAAL
ncbi:hypothetical protein MYCO108962_17685 [Mycobacterium colombiense]|uniref:Uncharacterized protein n=1 Tax=Mycobacterium colombiense CECT 3035 TaxID=1041522 RepID=J4JUX7_9MYCO|nr:hypothetical protein [Mycobacterium colombiense]EJO88057.1 hypothetical protein MCOL_V214044 [Mycobacterium colombiense CECT 3035]